VGSNPTLSASFRWFSGLQWRREFRVFGKLAPLFHRKSTYFLHVLRAKARTMVNRKLDKSGRSLERLVAALERALSDTNATIESPSRRLIDRDTKKPREHDVLITWDHGHHQIVTAIECRDRSRPVGVPDVEAFADKCASTGVNSGVIVSASSFCESARVKAQIRSIVCMDLSEVAAFDWLGTQAFIGFEQRFGDFNFTVMFGEVAPKVLTSLMDRDGMIVDVKTLKAIVMNNILQLPDFEEGPDKIFPINMRINTQNWTATDDDGIIWPVQYIQANTSYTVIKTVHNFKSIRYVGGGKDYSIASADVKMGSVSGKFLLVRNDDDSTSVIWTSDGAAS
jgi:hypothetical protein